MQKASVVTAMLAAAVTLTVVTSCSDASGPEGGPDVGSGETNAGETPVTGGQPGAACAPGMSCGTGCNTCTSGDGCCGPGCSAANDADCSAGSMGGSTEGQPVVGAIDAPTTPGGGEGAPPATETPPVVGRPPIMDPPVPPVIVCDESTIGGNAPNTLAIDVDAAQQVVHKEIFGVLMETLGRDVNGGLFVGRNSPIPNTNGLRNDIIQGFIDAGVGTVQWPGGCAANNYNWAVNTNPLNTMGTDLFMEFVQTIGAEPYITGRPNAADANSNRDWVRYINDNPAHPEWTLKYFKVGNEVWGCGGNQAQATYEANYNANYAVLSQPVNGKQLFIVAGTDLIGRNNNAWMDTMIPNLGGRMNGVEIHDYLYFPDAIPSVGFNDAQYYDIVNRANRSQIGARLDQLIGILDRRDPQKNIKIMEDEWGNWLIGFNEAQDPWQQQGTVMDAIAAAEQLHLFMSHADRIQMAALAQPINVIHSLFLTRQGDGVLVKTPTYYVFKMFLPHHTANARWASNTLSSETINGNGQNFPVLSSGATVDDTGAVNISLANVDLVNTRSIDITLDSSTTSYFLSSAQVITGAAKDSYNDFGQEERVNIQPLAASSVQSCGRSVSLALPSKSVVMLRLLPVP
jgi:alpha-L-arabinofuranosidase